MNTTNLALAAILALAPAAALGVNTLGPKKGLSHSSVAARESLRALPRGASFAAKGRQYQIVGARALRKGRRESDAAALARAKASAADVVARQGGFLVLRDPAAASPSAVMPAEGGDLPVAVNVRTGGVAIVLGVLNVKLRPGAEAAAIARAHGLTVDSQAPRLGLAFLRVPAGQDVAAAAAEVAADPGVASAEPDVLEHVAKLH